MRIRKRQVPFPLLPVMTHSSDPNLISRSPVMVQLNDAATKASSCTHHGPTTAPSPLLDLPQPSDQPLPPIGNPTNGSDETQHKKQEQQEESLVEDERKEKEEGEGQKGNDTRKGSISCSDSPAETFSSSSSPKQDGRWCEGDKAFPLKKRRGAFESATEDNNDDNDSDNNDKKIISRTKTRKVKMNKKYPRQDNGDIEEEVDNNEFEEEAMREKTKLPEQANVGNKKRVRGGALMEGSRCSRVNGRGWRCCQQTLVGYSLCEHHLGKGRLRSMTSVRNKSIGTSTTTATTSIAPKNNNNNNMPQSEKQITTTTKSSSEDPLGNNDDADENNDDEKKKPVVVVTKRRMKLGMVKARSISSLLGQTNTTNTTTEIVAMADEDNNDIK